MPCGNLVRRLWICIGLASAGAGHAAPGFLVAAPDRGFTGNEAVRDAYAPFASGTAAALVFVTAKGTEGRLDEALAVLRESGAHPVVLLPLYLSAAHPDLRKIEAWRQDEDGVLAGRLFGRSAAAPAALQEVLLAVGEPARTRIVLAGYGAETPEEAETMRRDLSALLAEAADGFGFASLDAAVWPQADEPEQDGLGERLASLEREDDPIRTVLLPFHLGPELDAMMGFTPRLRHAAPEGLDVPDATAGLVAAISRWLGREAARYQTLTPREIGVVVHAHGASWDWNETLRRGAAPVASEFPVEYAFSMGDPATLEHAVRHLEAQGAKAIVIVRVFGLRRSFRDRIERFIGEAWESCRPVGADDGHSHARGDDPAPRLRARLPLVTVGGLEDDPLFARALYERARGLSERPRRETVVLVAHGLGDAEGNAHWRKVLESLRDQMIAMGGDEFRAIEVGLWSEDWPELRRTAVEHIRGLVERGNENHGRVIVVPARTLGKGPSGEYLDGLDYVLAEGFSPHPLFAEWLRGQVRAGVERMHYGPNRGPACSPVRMVGNAAPAGSLDARKQAP